MTNYPSKDTFRCCVSIKCRKLPAEMTTKKRRWKKFEDLRYALSLPVICYTLQNPVNIFKDILTLNLTFGSLGENDIWHIKWSIMVNAKQSGFSNSLVLCWFPSITTGCFTFVVVGFFNSASFLFSCSLLGLITDIVHGLLSLKITCCLVYLPCTWFIPSCSSVPCYSDWGVKLLTFTEQRKQFHLLKVDKGRIIKWLQWQFFRSIYLNFLLCTNMGVYFLTPCSLLPLIPGDSWKNEAALFLETVGQHLLAPHEDILASLPQHWYLWTVFTLWT